MDFFEIDRLDPEEKYHKILEELRGYLDKLKENDSSAVANPERALFQIAQLRNFKNYDEEQVLSRLSLDYPFLAELYLSKGEIAQAYTCAAALAEHNIYYRALLLTLPLALDDGPFLANKEHRLLAFFAESIKTFGISCLNKSIHQCINNIYPEKTSFEAVPKSLPLADKLKEIDSSLNLNSNLSDCISRWMAAVHGTPLEKYRQDVIPASSDLITITKWVQNLYSKEIAFRKLLSYCQDYRYGRSEIDTALDTLNSPLFHHALHYCFPEPMEKLWVLHHLLTKSLRISHAYTRRDNLYALNIQCWGLELRKDNISLSETQALHYRKLKQLGLECIKSALQSSRRDSYENFVTNEITFFDTHLSHYQLAIEFTEKTRSHRQVELLKKSSKPAERRDELPSLEQILSHNQPANISTLDLFYRSGYLTTESIGLASVKNYYDRLENALRIDLLAQQLMATGKFQSKPSKAHMAFNLIFSAAETAASALPLVAVIMHLAHHTIELTHHAVCTSLHASKTVHELYEMIHSNHSDVNELLQKNPKHFIQALCLDLAMRFSHELKFLNNKGITACVALHSHHILEQICQTGKTEPPLTPLALYKNIMAEFDPSPSTYAEREIARYTTQESFYSRWEWRLTSFSDQQEQLRIQSLCRKLSNAIHDRGNTIAGAVHVHAIARSVLIASSSSDYEPLAYHSAHLGLDNALITSLNIEIPADAKQYHGQLPVFSSTAAYNAASGQDPISLVNLMQRITLLMLRQIVLLQQKQQSPALINQEREIIKSFTQTTTEQQIATKIKLLEEQIKSQEKRIEALEKRSQKQNDIPYNKRNDPM